MRRHFLFGLAVLHETKPWSMNLTSVGRAKGLR
jgi:hypothetical protein